MTSEMLKEKAPADIIDNEIIPALDIVGKGYEEKKVFLPQLLIIEPAASSAPFPEIILFGIKNSRDIFFTLVHQTAPPAVFAGEAFLSQSLSALSTAPSITVAPSVQCLTEENSGSQWESPSLDCTNIMVVGSIYEANCAS